jgi:hypothetical protein
VRLRLIHAEHQLEPVRNYRQRGKRDLREAPTDAICDCLVNICIGIAQSQRYFLLMADARRRAAVIWWEFERFNVGTSNTLSP